MRVRRSHYELAFEAYLAARGTPCVAIEDVKHLAKNRSGIKIFDYIVYPPGGPACLVDVKGRKSQRASADADCRQKTWVTRADLDGLKAWQKVFGDDYLATFVFAFWLADYRQADKRGGIVTSSPLFNLANRHYSFWLVPVEEYAKYQKLLSKSWRTVSIPRDVFRRISRRLDHTWTAAPC